MDRPIETISEHFGLGEVRSVESVAGTRNECSILATALGKFLLRSRFSGYSDASRLKFDHAALSFLSSRDIPVPTPIVSANGESSLRVGKETFELLPFFEGSPMEEGNEVQLSELGKALGRFHEAGHNFIPRHDKLGPRGETDPELLCRQIEEIERSAPDCADALKRYGGWLESASEALPDNLYSSLPHTLVHGDVQPANVLFDGNRFAAWLDLDWVARRPRIYDLAFAILFCCAERETPIQSDDIRSLTQPYAWRPDREERFMVGYEGVAGALTEGERECLGSQVKLSWCHARIAGALKVEAGKRREFLERRPVEVSFFEKHPAQRSVD